MPNGDFSAGTAAPAPFAPVLRLVSGQTSFGCRVRCTEPSAATGSREHCALLEYLVIRGLAPSLLLKVMLDHVGVPECGVHVL